MAVNITYAFLSVENDKMIFSTLQVLWFKYSKHVCKKQINDKRKNTTIQGQAVDPLLALDFF